MKTVPELLAEHGFSLPQVAPAAANYVPYVIAGNQLFIAGQIPFINGEKRHIARLGENYTVEQGRAAAQDCALNILAQVNAAVASDWAQVVRCVKLGGFVNATPAFDQHPAVVNGASDLMVAVLGERGRHARFAVGASNLPFGVAVEIDAVFEILT